MRFRNSLATVGSAALALSLAACGGSPTSTGTAGGGDGSAAAPTTAQAVYDKYNALSGQERTDALLADALKEGTLSLYTSNNDMEDLVAAFEKDYDIHVDLYRADSETVLQRLLQENSAHKVLADVLEINAGEMNAADHEGMLYPYESEYRDKVRPEGIHDNWTADRFNAFVVGWNTDLVKPGEEPTSFEDLASPRWKGKLAIEVNDMDWYASLYLYYQDQGKDKAWIDDLFNKIAANSVLTKGHSATGDMLVSGQFAVFVTAYNQNIDGPRVEDGAPVAWRTDTAAPVQPITLRPNGVALLKEAKHPAAALLFTDWLLTRGQEELAKVQRLPAVIDGEDPLEGLELILPPEDDLLNNSAEWSKRYEEVTSHAGGTAQQ